MSRFSAVLDTNVLYGSYVRDVLLEFATAGFYEPRWSDEILEELTRALLRKSPGTEAQQKLKIQHLNNSFPDALVSDFLHLTENLDGTDEKDRHVLAAAIRDQSGALVTFNLKHFPKDLFSRHGIELIGPDDFLLDLVDLNEQAGLAAISGLLANYKRPELRAIEFASVLNKSQCPEFAKFVANHEHDIDVLAEQMALVIP